MSYISNILVQNCLCSLSSSLVEARPSETVGNEKSIFANDTYPMCENVNSRQMRTEELTLVDAGTVDW